MNFSAVVEWAKANIFIVIFSLIIIAAPIALWFVSHGMNSAVRDEVDRRAKNYPALVSLENTVIELPGQASVKGMINDNFLRQYGQYAEAVGKDADLVQKAAVEHNRDHHGVVMDGVLPAMPADKVSVLPQKFWEALVGIDGENGAYQKLLAEVGASAPPTLESMRAEIERVQLQYITQTLQKDPSAPLTDQDTKNLQQKLSDLRVGQCQAAAEKIGFYLTIDQLQTPQHWAWPAQPIMTDLYNWQWQLWIQEDILRALHAANKDDQSVAHAPVKRVVALNIMGLPGAAAPAGGTPGTPGPGRLSANTGGSGAMSEGAGAPPRAPGASLGGATGAGGGGGGAGEGDEGGGAAAGAGRGAANAKAPVPMDYSASFTGRTTNSLYDVVWVDLTLIVETARLNKVIDALAQQNFMTVSGLHLEPADPFEATREGYFYGDYPVSMVTMRLETIWLRAWTSPLMPVDVKKVLNVPVQQAAPAGAAAAAPGTP